MSDYFPDKWTVVKITDLEDNTYHYRILGSWYGGYLGADSWRLNSGISRVERTDSGYDVHGESSSIYHCNKKTVGMSSYAARVISTYQKGYEDSLRIEYVENPVEFLEGLINE